MSDEAMNSDLNDLSQLWLPIDRQYHQQFTTALTTQPTCKFRCRVNNRFCSRTLIYNLNHLEARIQEEALS